MAIEPESKGPSTARLLLLGLYLLGGVSFVLAVVSDSHPSPSHVPYAIFGGSLLVGASILLHGSRPGR